MAMKTTIQNSKKYLMKSPQNKLAMVFLATYLWGMLAHSYGFTHSAFTKDSLNGVYIETSEELWKVAVGRIFVNLYRVLVRGNWAMPWLIGILALAFIAIAVKLIADMFDIESRLGLIFLSAFMVVNKTVTNLTGTYIFELDIDMLAMLLSVIAAYCWTKTGKYWILGSVFICCSLGLYQAYISVTVTLMILYLLYRLLKDGNFSVKLSIKGIVELLAGGVLYILCLLCINSVWKIDVFKTNSYNGLGKLQNHILFRDLGLNWKGRLMELYLMMQRVVNYRLTLLTPKECELFVICGVVLFLTGAICVGGLSRKRDKLSAGFLIMFLPIGMDIVAFLGGFTHSLMEFAWIFIYLFALILLRYNSGLLQMKGPAVYVQYVLFFLCVLTIWNGIVSANELHLKRDLEDKARLSYISRVLYRLEAEPGFPADADSYAIIGSSNDMNSSRESYSMIQDEALVYYQYDTFRAYGKYVLAYDLPYCEPERIIELANHPIVEKLSPYPSEGCVALVDGVYIIKVSD